jgi:hypothetical protein
MPRGYIWFANHWKMLSVFGVGVGIFERFVMWWMNVTKLRREERQAKLDREDRATIQKVALYAASVKRKHGPTVAFREDDLRGILLPKQQLRLHAAMEALRKDGRAEQNPDGTWLFL